MCRLKPAIHLNHRGRFHWMLLIICKWSKLQAGSHIHPGLISFFWLPKMLKSYKQQCYYDQSISRAFLRRSQFHDLWCELLIVRDNGIWWNLENSWLRCLFLHKWTTRMKEREVQGTCERSCIKSQNSRITYSLKVKSFLNCQKNSRILYTYIKQSNQI